MNVLLNDVTIMDKDEALRKRFHPMMIKFVQLLQGLPGGHTVNDSVLMSTVLTQVATLKTHVCRSWGESVDPRFTQLVSAVERALQHIGKGVNIDTINLDRSITASSMTPVDAQSSTTPTSS